MTKQRNLFLDYFRGIAIIIVVLGHALLLCDETATDPLLRLIQTFQMSLLFVISGFSSGFSEPMKNSKSFLLGKVKRILLPYLVWIQIHYILTACVSGYYSVVGQLKSVLVSQFWFLRILFLMFLVYWAFVMIYRALHKLSSGPLNVLIAAVVAAILTVLISRIPGCGSLLNYLPFFVLGNLLYKLSKKYDAKVYRSAFTILAGILAVVFVVSIVLLSKTQGIIYILIDKSMALSGVAACYIVCRLLYAIPWLKKLTTLVEKIGKNTLPVYAIHWCIFFSLPLPLYSVLANSIGLHLSALIVALVWLVLCMVMIYLLQKNKFTRNLLLGEK